MDDKIDSWFAGFWVRHGERLIYAFLALALATTLYNLGMKAEAKTVYIGITMLFFHKARGTNGKDKQ